MVEKLQLLGRRVDLLAVDDELVGVKVDDKFIKDETLVRVLGDLAAAQHGVDAREQLLHFKGLDDIVVRAHLKAVDAVVDLALGGEHDDRALRCLADLGAHAPAVEHGEHHVEQHEVGLFFLEFLHGDADVKALFVEIHLNEVGNIIVVLHDKNIACHAVFLLHTSVCLSSVLLFIIRKTVRVS